MSTDEEPRDLYGMVPDTHDTALLIIDVINSLDFDGNEDIVKIGAELGKHIAAVKEAASDVGIPVVYINDNFGRWKSDFNKIIEHVIGEDTPGKPLAELLIPNEDDYFVLKPKHSAFYCTPLDILLSHLGSKTVILTGVAGNICVLFTANDAYMRNLKLIIPSDCIASNTAAENEACLEQMVKLLKADTRPSVEIIKDIEKLPKKSKRKDDGVEKKIIRK